MNSYEGEEDYSYQQDGQYGDDQQAIQPGPQGSGSNLRRKSLLIGINYEGQDCALQGCRQDVMNMVYPVQLVCCGRMLTRTG